MKKSFILYLDSLSVIDKMSDEQVGKLFRMMKSYNNWRNYICDDFSVELVFDQFKNQFDRDLEKYNNVCNRNSSNGKLGWRPKKDETQINPKNPSGYLWNPNKPRKADNDNDNDNDNDSGNNILSKDNTTIVAEEKKEHTPIQKKEKLFEKFRSLYPNKKGKARARTIRMKIKWVDYNTIITACTIHANECKGKDLQFIKRWDTRLSQQCWEDYPMMTREELIEELRATFHWDIEARPDTAYGKNMKPRYEAMFGGWWYDIWMEDKEKVKKDVEKIRKEYRLSHKWQDMPW